MGSYQGKVYNTPEEAEEFVKNTIQAHPVVLFTKRFSPYCYKATSSFKSINVKYEEVLLSGRPDMQIIQDVLLKMTGARTVPRVFIHQKCIGGGNETSALNKENKLKDLVDAKDAEAKEDAPVPQETDKTDEHKEDGSKEEQGKDDVAEEQHGSEQQEQAEASPKHSTDPVEQESSDAPAPEASEPAPQNQVEDEPAPQSQVEENEPAPQSQVEEPEPAPAEQSPTKSVESGDVQESQEQKDD